LGIARKGLKRKKYCYGGTQEPQVIKSEKRERAAKKRGGKSNSHTKTYYWVQVP